MHHGRMIGLARIAVRVIAFMVISFALGAALGLAFVIFTFTDPGQVDAVAEWANRVLCHAHRSLASML